MIKEPRNKVASVRFTEADWAAIVRAAKREGMDAGEFVAQPR